MQQDRTRIFHIVEQDLAELKKKYLDTPLKKPRSQQSFSFRNSPMTYLHTSSSRGRLDTTEKLRQRIEEEQRKSTQLDQEISEKQSQIEELRKSVNGLPNTLEKQKELSKRIKTYENSLEKAIQK